MCNGCEPTGTSEKWGDIEGSKGGSDCNDREKVGMVWARRKKRQTRKPQSIYRDADGREDPGAKTIKKNTNSTQNKRQTYRAKQYEVTSFLSTECELSTETCSKNVYSLGPRLRWKDNVRRDKKAWNIKEEWATHRAKWKGLCKARTPHREMVAKGEKVDLHAAKRHVESPYCASRCERWSGRPVLVASVPPPGLTRTCWRQTPSSSCPQTGTDWNTANTTRETLISSGTQTPTYGLKYCEHHKRNTHILRYTNTHIRTEILRTPQEKHSYPPVHKHPHTDWNTANTTRETLISSGTQTHRYEIHCSWFQKDSKD